jgi:hypothetical protein
MARGGVVFSGTFIRVWQSHLGSTPPGDRGDASWGWLVVSAAVAAAAFGHGLPCAFGPLPQGLDKCCADGINPACCNLLASIGCQTLSKILDAFVELFVLVDTS